MKFDSTSSNSFVSLKFLSCYIMKDTTYFTKHLLAYIYLLKSHSHTLFFNLCERKYPCWFLFTLIVSMALPVLSLRVKLCHNKDTRTTEAEST
jgi:hypothetical protein